MPKQPKNQKERGEESNKSMKYFNFESENCIIYKVMQNKYLREQELIRKGTLPHSRAMNKST